MPTFLGRVHRTRLPESDEVSVTLDLIRDDDLVELTAGDEFVTVQIPVDPFTEPRA
jgi:hypothetical protein